MRRLHGTGAVNRRQQPFSLRESRLRPEPSLSGVCSRLSDERRGILRARRALCRSAGHGGLYRIRMRAARAHVLRRSMRRYVQRHFQLRRLRERVHGRECLLQWYGVQRATVQRRKLCGERDLLRIRVLRTGRALLHRSRSRAGRAASLRRTGWGNRQLSDWLPPLPMNAKRRVSGLLRIGRPHAGHAEKRPATR